MSDAVSQAQRHLNNIAICALKRELKQTFIFIINISCRIGKVTLWKEVTSNYQGPNNLMYTTILPQYLYFLSIYILISRVYEEKRHFVPIYSVDGYDKINKRETTDRPPGY